ncbi:MAG: hypothetical protein ABI702_14090 [Burkholderiales bacterium]
MANPRGRGVTQNLTRIGLVVSPRRGVGKWLARAALALVCLATGAAATHFYESRQADRLQQQAEAAHDQQQLQQQLEQTRLALRMSEGRGQELEREIATLIQKLRECQEELTFFRKARDGKR